jgi:hypothetical protein
MSMMNETYRFQRDQSRAAKSRVLTSIRSRMEGPEKYLSLGALEVKTPTRKVTAFMGPGGSEYADFTATDRYVAPTRERQNTTSKKRRDSVAAEAQRLLDELNGITRREAIDVRGPAATDSMESAILPRPDDKCGEPRPLTIEQ